MTKTVVGGEAALASFVISVDNATAAAVHIAIEHTQDEVQRQFGVRLVPEARYLG